MLKHLCDNCKKVLKKDYIGVDAVFDRYHFCVLCIKFIPKFLEKVVRDKKALKSKQS